MPMGMYLPSSYLLARASSGFVLFCRFMRSEGWEDCIDTGVGVLKLLVSTVMGNFPTALKVWSE